MSPCSNGAKLLRLKLVQKPYRSLNSVYESCYFYESLIFTRVAFLCQNLSCACLLFAHLALFLTQFLSMLFLGIVSKTGGDCYDSSREEEDKVENIILQFG